MARAKCQAADFRAFRRAGGTRLAAFGRLCRENSAGSSARLNQLL